MTDDLAEIAMLRQRLADAEQKLGMDPDYRLGELVRAVAAIDARLGRLVDDMHSAWPMVRQSLDEAKAAHVTVLHVGSLVTEQYQELVRRIDHLPCQPGGGNGHVCPDADTERPKPLRLVDD